MNADVIQETTFQVEYATLSPAAVADDDGDVDVDSTRRPSVSLVAVQAVRLHRSAFYDFEQISWVSEVKQSPEKISGCLRFPPQSTKLLPRTISK